MRGLDPEEVRAIIDPVLQLMMDAVHRYGGYVAQSTGDGIFAVFGAPVAHEDHPQRALHAALLIQQELVCSKSFSSAGSRSIREARTACTVGGSFTSISGRISFNGAIASERSLFEQRLYDFFNEEGIAFAAFRNQAPHWLEFGFISEQCR